MGIAKRIAKALRTQNGEAHTQMDEKMKSSRSLLSCFCLQGDLNAPVQRPKGSSGANGKQASAFSLSVTTNSLTGTVAGSPRVDTTSRRLVTVKGQPPPGGDANAKTLFSDTDECITDSAYAPAASTSNLLGTTSTSLVPNAGRDSTPFNIAAGVSSASAFTEVFHPWRHPRRPKVRTSRVSPADGTADELSAAVAAAAAAVTMSGELSPSASTASLPRSIDGRTAALRSCAEDDGGGWDDDDDDGSFRDGGGGGPGGVPPPAPPVPKVSALRRTAVPQRLQSGRGSPLEDDDDDGGEKGDGRDRTHPGMVTIPSFHKSCSAASRASAAAAGLRTEASGASAAAAAASRGGATAPGPDGEDRLSALEPRAVFVRRGASCTGAPEPQQQPALATATSAGGVSASHPHARRSSFTGDSSHSLVGPGTIAPVVLGTASASQSGPRASGSLRPTPPSLAQPVEPELLLQPSPSLRQAPPLSPTAPSPTALRLAPLSAARLLTPCPSLRPPPLPPCGSLTRQSHLPDVLLTSPPQPQQTQQPQQPPQVSSESQPESHGEIVPYTEPGASYSPADSSTEGVTSVLPQAAAAAGAADAHGADLMLRLPPPHPLFGHGPHHHPGGCSFGRNLAPLGPSVLPRAGALAPLPLPMTIPGEAPEASAGAGAGHSHAAAVTVVVPVVPATLNRIASMQAAYRQRLLQEGPASGADAGGGVGGDGDDDGAQGVHGARPPEQQGQAGLSPSHPVVTSEATAVSAAASATAAAVLPRAVVDEHRRGGGGERRHSDGAVSCGGRRSARFAPDVLDADRSGGVADEDEETDSVVGDLPHAPASLRATPSMLIRALSLEPSCMCRTASMDPSRPSPGALSDVYDAYNTSAAIRAVRGSGGETAVYDDGTASHSCAGGGGYPTGRPKSRRAFDPAPDQEDGLAAGTAAAGRTPKATTAVAAAAAAVVGASPFRRPGEADSFRCLLRELE